MGIPIFLGSVKGRGEFAGETVGSRQVWPPAWAGLIFVAEAKGILEMNKALAGSGGEVIVSKGFSQLMEINQGEGFWVNVSEAIATPRP